jgi:hypothetical protein
MQVSGEVEVEWNPLRPAAKVRHLLRDTRVEEGKSYPNFLRKWYA